MRDTELYRHLLGLETPWKVGRVELSATDRRVDVWVEHPARTRFACPDCDAVLSVYAVNANTQRIGTPTLVPPELTPTTS